MTRTIYAVERREGDYWRVVGGKVFATRAAAEYFEEKYVETDLSGASTTVDLRITRYLVDR